MRWKRGWVAAAAAGLAVSIAGAVGAQRPELLKEGETAPNFTLKTPEGKAVTLADVAKNKKATLVNFFFNG